MTFGDRSEESARSGEWAVMCGGYTGHIGGQLRDGGGDLLNSFLNAGDLNSRALTPTLKIKPAGTDIIQNELDGSLQDWKQVRMSF